ncbi:hypothetical protein IW262DRAFT_292361 [Armillaria fumosa]|nr:hypothetical protein IW262DRAFT_292361 [Armillaria fumosa]
MDLSDVSFGRTETSSPSMEAKYYYAGLPSSPILVARTSTSPWVMPKGLEAYHEQKQLYPVFNHKLNTLWDGDLARKVHACLDELDVNWTSTDVVRIGRLPASAPVILWIGVVPKSLSGEDGSTVACRCREVLREFDITDVEVEIRESSVIRSAGPKLLEPVPFRHPIADVQGPLTHALGLPIAAQATPNIEGTGGFFMTEGDSKKLLVVTARHVVFPTNKGPNSKFERKSGSQPRVNVLLLGDTSYQELLASILTRIRRLGVIVEHEERLVKAAEGKDDQVAKEARENAQRALDEANKTIRALSAFYQDVEKKWNTHASRVLGRVVLSPPISLGTGTEGYTEDYAIIEVDDDKIDRSTFQGNTIDLGTEIPRWEFTEKMSSNFKYPNDRLLKLRGTITDEEMGHPAMLDENDEPCLVVMKSGRTTGVTIGRASGAVSFVRECVDGAGDYRISKGWAILPYDVESGSFSSPGDSGSVVVDGCGRVGGLLTGGAGAKDTSDVDVSYATPIGFLLESIRANGYPNARLDPD